MPTAEQLEIQALAREFAESELRPRAAGWDARRALDDRVFAELAELGFLGMLVPEEHGGLGFDFATYLLVLEELARGDASVALTVAVQNGPVGTLLSRHGSDEQKARWLPALASGEAIGAFALSEPGAGSDAASLETRARPDGDGWCLTGDKRWVTNGARAGLVIVFARVEGEVPGEDGDARVGAFLVAPGADGYRVGKREQTLGLRASETVSVALDDVRVGPDGLVGDAAQGLHYALEALDVGRVGCAAQAVGIGRAAMEHAAAYALEREQFDGPIARFGAIQEKLARMAERLAAARALAFEAAAALDAAADGSGHPRTGLGGVTARAALAKVCASEAATWVADEAIQIFGGYGYMRHYPVERLLRDAKGTEILEGTSEIMRHVIARELLRDAGDESL
ncbi:MAG TPA: acyl-CoA dehydrogenase family protein [Longimicrobiales bacterium]|nr:acyl-CoA dehydrogenase family protein [Longimicrobiales bacterium]